MRPNPFSHTGTASDRARLHALMTEVIDAEEQLTATRQRYRAAVQKAGLDPVGIFSTCEWISRSTGEMWRREGFEAGQRAARKDDNPPADEDTVDDQGGDDQSPGKPRDGKRKKKDKAADEPEDTSPDRRDPDAAYWRAVRREADLIVAAAAKARGERPKPPSQAAAIYESNLRVYDAERNAGLPWKPSAEMIVMAAKKLRGEL
jgi:hypothetical protein